MLGKEIEARRGSQWAESKPYIGGFVDRCLGRRKVDPFVTSQKADLQTRHWSETHIVSKFCTAWLQEQQLALLKSDNFTHRPSSYAGGIFLSTQSVIHY